MIEVSTTADVAVVRMCHGKANAMSTAFCEALTARFDALIASPARAIVLTGTGRIFSAGVDLLRLLDGGAPYVHDFLPVLGKMLATVFSCPKPVVAAINGHAVAGGCVLACACDKRLMDRSGGRIGVTELRVGVPFPAIAMEIMRCAAGGQDLPELIFGAATYAPEEAIERGLVDEVVEAEALLARAVSAAETLAALSPGAFALSKRQTRRPALARLEQEGRAVDAEVTRIWTAPETLERIRDYVARTFRKP